MGYYIFGIVPNHHRVYDSNKNNDNFCSHLHVRKTKRWLQLKRGLLNDSKKKTRLHKLNLISECIKRKDRLHNRTRFNELLTKF